MKRTNRFLVTVLAVVLLHGCIADEVGGVYLVTREFGEFQSVAGQGVEVTFTAGDTWTAHSSADWITVTPASGQSGRSVITILTAAPNRTKQPRSAVVSILSGGKQKDITVSQRDEYAVFDQKEYVVEPEGGTISMAFETNVKRGSLLVSYYKLDWLTWEEDSAAATRGDDWRGRVKTVQIMPNTKPEPRATPFVLVMYGKNEEMLGLDTAWVRQRALKIAPDGTDSLDFSL